MKKAERLGTLALCVDDYCADTAAGWDEAVTATYASAQLQDFLKHAFETVVSDAYDHVRFSPVCLNPFDTD